MGLEGTSEDEGKFLSEQMRSKKREKKREGLGDSGGGGGSRPRGRPLQSDAATREEEENPRRNLTRGQQ